MKMKKGSYTVEAALLMGILIPLLTGVIYLGFFMELRQEHIPPPFAPNISL